MAVYWRILTGGCGLKGKSENNHQVVRFINKWEGNNISPYKNENGIEVIGTYAVSKITGWGIIAEQPA